MINKPHVIFIAGSSRNAIENIIVDVRDLTNLEGKAKIHQENAIQALQIAYHNCKQLEQFYNREQPK